MNADYWDFKLKLAKTGNDICENLCPINIKSYDKRQAAVFRV